MLGIYGGALINQVTENPSSLTFEDNKLVRDLVGTHNSHLNCIEKALNITIQNRGNEFTLHGEEEDVAAANIVLNALWHKLEKGQDISLPEVEAAIRFARNEPQERLKGLNDKNRKTGSNQPPAKTQSESLGSYLDESNIIKTPRKTISPRSPHQAQYIELMKDKDMVFAMGPGGTGKTYLAVAYAIKMYIAGEIERMIFTRPAVEAGENLGFLPGDIQEKIDPYLRPIYDALFDVFQGDKVAKNTEKGNIEIAPLAFMRGRTLKNAFVLLDEAQNTTSAQMKMFLTRMGEGSKMVITGDPSQIDLPPKNISGLTESVDILKNLKNVGFINFTSKDVVRHKLVSEIIDAYDRHSNKK